MSTFHQQGPSIFYKSQQLNTHLLRTGNMLFNVSEMKIKYAHEKPDDTKSLIFIIYFVNKKMLIYDFQILSGEFKVLM